MNNDVVEVSYTGDLLAHRRCPRSWAYEKYARFAPYEQVQAMEGRLVHHAMEWLTRRYAEHAVHANRVELRAQLEKHFRVLWARGIRTAFTSKNETLERVADHLYPAGRIDPIVRAAVEGAQHSEYELKTVRKLIKADFGGKGRLLLTGVLDVVIQQKNPLTYHRSWKWLSTQKLEGETTKVPITAAVGDLEIWDYKATKSNSPFVPDYVRQLLTYAALYKERTLRVPARCVLFFINETTAQKRLLAISVDQPLVEHAVDWTIQQVKLLRKTTLKFHTTPMSVEGGALDKHHLALGNRTDDELRQQCTACGLRFDCAEYGGFLGRPDHPDIALTNVAKN